MPSCSKYSASNRHPDCKCRINKPKQFGFNSQNTIGCPVHFCEGCFGYYEDENGYWVEEK